MSTKGPYLTSSMYSFESPSMRTKMEQLEYDLKITRARLEAFSEQPQIQASVLGVTKTKVTICTGPQTITVKRPPAMDIKPGDLVDVKGGDPPGICQVSVEQLPTGPIGTVKQVLDETSIEVNVGNQSIIALAKKEFEIQAGDRVVLDATSKVVVKNIGRGDSSHHYTADTGISWDDIGGLEEAKRALQEAIEEPITHRVLYKKYSRQPTRGILLYGSAGNGKTLLGRACATSLAKIHGESAKEGGFIYVKGPDVLNMFVGNSEAAIRALFSSAREHHKRAGYPAIIFIDEADAIMGKRGMRMHEGIERTIVPQFLAEMDGLEDAGCLVLLATNRPDILDPAIVRPKRVDKKIHVRRPTQSESKDIFDIYLRKLPLGEKDLAAKASEMLFDDRHALFIIRTKDGKDRRFAMRDLVSGALIDTIVSSSSQNALRRERDKKEDTGILFSDVSAAIKEEIENARALDHSSELKAIIEDEKLSPTAIEAVK